MQQISGFLTFWVIKSWLCPQEQEEVALLAIESM